ncbi:radical SAM protein [Desulfococcaceae bacterium HSG7]|nr:radical SAM protein [Desulfococcaceae bacterium HSG7]
MKTIKDKLLAILHDRPLLIWGARMTGIGFLRFAKKHNLNVIGFVDSDPSLNGAKISNVPICSPDKIVSLMPQYKKLAIIIAVSIKEDEIIDVLKRMGLSRNDYIKYSEYCEYFFTIDVVGTCNLKCPSCVYSMENITYPKGFMSFDDFKKIIKKMLREVGIVSHISFYSWGEPFLHPQMNLFIEYAHSMGIATAVSTNLSISSSKQIKKIIKSSPDYLKISLSGYYPEIYNSTHTGGDINLVKSNLYKIKYLLEKYKTSIFVEVNYHLYKNNYDNDQKKMKELCDELDFSFAPCYANVTPIERLIDYCEGNLDFKTKDFLKLLLVDIDKGLEITKNYRNLSCRFLTNQVNINWDRSVPLCCVCFDRTKPIIISDDYLKDSLQNISTKKENHPLCKKCLGYGFPPYLLGVNQKGWKEEANRNISKNNMSTTKAL